MRCSTRRRNSRHLTETASATPNASLTETDFTAELEDFAGERDIDLRSSLASDAAGLADAAAVMGTTG